MTADRDPQPARYEVVRRLGAGGMGEVLLGRQRMAGGVVRTVVLKTMLPHMAGNRAHVDLFLREARLVASLSHPNIVQILDITEHNGSPCIVMEYLRGGDLSAVLRRASKNGDWPSAQTSAGMIAQAADGLHHAHAHVGEDDAPASIIHRDVSPQNLFVSREGTVKVLDFGIARSTNDPRTQTGVLRGKLAYMAPEQLDGSRRSVIGPAADQFALGVVLWECLAKRRLYQRPTPIETMKAVVGMPVPGPSGLSGSPSLLDPIVLRALARDPRDRWPSCAHLAQALRDAARSLGGGTSETDLVRAIASRAFAEVPATPAPEQSGEVLAPAREAPSDDFALAGTEEASDDDETWLETYLPPTELAVAVAPPAAPAARASRAPVLVAAIGVVVLASAAAAWRFSRGQVDPPPLESAPVVAHVEPEAPRAPADVTVRFEGVPDGARVELDGTVLAGGAYHGPPLEGPRAVRVVRGDDVLWSGERGVTGDETVVLALTDVASPSPPPPRSGPSRGRTSSRPDRSRADPHVLVRHYPSE